LKNEGFTLVEILVSIVIIGISVSSLSFAIARGIQHHESIRLKHAAYLDLKRFTEFYRSKLAAGYAIDGTHSPAQDQYCLKTRSTSQDDFGVNATDCVDAQRTYSVEKVERPGYELSKFYKLKTWIRYKENLNGLNEGGWKTLEFETHQIPIK